MMKLSKICVFAMLLAPLWVLGASPAAAGSERVGGKAYHHDAAHRSDGARGTHLGAGDRRSPRSANYDRPDDRRAGQDRVDDRHGSRYDKKRAHRRVHRQHRHRDGRAPDNYADRHKAHKYGHRREARRHDHDFRQPKHHRKAARHASRHRSYETAHKKKARHGKQNCWNMRHKAHSYGRPALISTTACRTRHGRTYVVPGSSYVVRYLY